MKYRIDIDGIDEGKPRLVGLWLEGFSWVLGGGESGESTIRGDLKVDPSSDWESMAAIDRLLAERPKYRAKLWEVEA